MEAIRNQSFIPYIAPVDDRQYTVIDTVADETHGAVRIRLRFSGKIIEMFSYFIYISAKPYRW